MLAGGRVTGSSVVGISVVPHSSAYEGCRMMERMMSSPNSSLDVFFHCTEKLRFGTELMGRLGFNVSYFSDFPWRERSKEFSLLELSIGSQIPSGGSLLISPLTGPTEKEQREHLIFWLGVQPIFMMPLP